MNEQQRNIELALGQIKRYTAKKNMNITLRIDHMTYNVWSDKYTFKKVVQTDSGVVVTGDTLRMTNSSQDRNYKFMQVMSGEDSGMVVDIIDGVVYAQRLISKEDFILRNRKRRVADLVQNL